MDLTERRRDALVELINIAFGRTAASLSQLTGDRVVLAVPQVAICVIDELQATLANVLQGELASVHQIFTGPVDGDALLLLDYASAVQLKELLTGEPTVAARLDQSGREVLTEVGNILLNACLGMFGNLLKVRVSFSVPRLHLDTLAQLLKSLQVAERELRHALIVHTAFSLRDSEVSGYMVLILGLSSLDRLLEEVDRWEAEESRG